MATKLERIKVLLHDAGFEGDPLEALGDLIDELKSVSEDHARLECLNRILDEKGSVTLVKSTNPYTTQVYGIVVDGKVHRGAWLNAALDEVHKDQHPEKK